MPRAAALVVPADTAGVFVAFVVAAGAAFCAWEKETKTVSALIAPMSFKCALLILASHLDVRPRPILQHFLTRRVARRNHQFTAARRFWTLPIAPARPATGPESADISARGSFQSQSPSIRRQCEQSPG